MTAQSESRSIVLLSL